MSLNLALLTLIQNPPGQAPPVAPLLHTLPPLQTIYISPSQHSLVGSIIELIPWGLLELDPLVSLIHLTVLGVFKVVEVVRNPVLFQDALQSGFRQVKESFYNLHLRIENVWQDLKQKVPFGL